MKGMRLKHSSGFFKDNPFVSCYDLHEVMRRRTEEQKNTSAHDSFFF